MPYAARCKTQTLRLKSMSKKNLTNDLEILHLPVAEMTGEERPGSKTRCINLPTTFSSRKSIKASVLDSAML